MVKLNLAQPDDNPKLTFGKHKGKFISEVDTHYLDWMLDQSFDEDLLAAVREELEKRPDWQNDDFSADDDERGLTKDDFDLD